MNRTLSWFQQTRKAFPRWLGTQAHNLLDIIDELEKTLLARSKTIIELSGTIERLTEELDYHMKNKEEYIQLPLPEGMIQPCSCGVLHEPPGEEYHDTPDPLRANSK